MDPVTTAVGAYSSIRSAANTAMEIKKATAKTSITRLTKDQIFQFPMIMSSDISSEENYHIVKTIERNYATLILAAITNEGVIDRDKYGNINQFLKRFHDNMDLPFATESDTEYEVTNAVATEGYIPQEELRNIFKRFYRADPARSRTGSFGLGLSIAESITKQHRGRIWAESRDGVNSFCVELPCL